MKAIKERYKLRLENKKPRHNILNIVAFAIFLLIVLVLAVLTKRI